MKKGLEGYLLYLYIKRFNIFSYVINKVKELFISMVLV